MAAGTSAEARPPVSAATMMHKASDLQTRMGKTPAIAPPHISQQNARIRASAGSDFAERFAGKNVATEPCAPTLKPPSPA